jgi:CheY-like chemotaxis protein
MPQPKSVLLVDGDPTTAFLHQRLFRRLHVPAHLHFAANGQEALDVLSQLCAEPDRNCPVLVLLDLYMPVMNGLEFLAHYQQLSTDVCSTTVVVVLTTSQHPADMARVQRYPVKGILTKPLNEAKVNDLLRDHFAHA